MITISFCLLSSLLSFFFPFLTLLPNPPWVPSPSIDPFLVPAPPSLPGPALSPHPVALFGVRPEPAWVCRPLCTLRKRRHTLGSRASESLASVGRLTDQGLTWEMPGAWGCGPWPSSWGVHWPARFGWKRPSDAWVSLSGPLGLCAFWRGGGIQAAPHHRALLHGQVCCVLRPLCPRLCGGSSRGRAPGPWAERSEPQA